MIRYTWGNQEAKEEPKQARRQQELHISIKTTSHTNQQNIK